MKMNNYQNQSGAATPVAARLHHHQHHLPNNHHHHQQHQHQYNQQQNNHQKQQKQISHLPSSSPLPPPPATNLTTTAVAATTNLIMANAATHSHHSPHLIQHVMTQHTSPLPPATASPAPATVTPPQPLINNSLAIRQEIQRFESVHPSIYAIYDLIDLMSITDAQIAQQIRDHVVCIEDSFVNSQEWTISRSVPDLRLGIVGSLSSGKSALVHRYLTGSYMQEESPEGGRFKKEVFIDGQSYLLLIRDEGGAPEMQFAAWVDAVIFVFSLENESSFNTVYNYYTKMAHFRNGQDIPMILVGTQDAISERNPRVIDDSRARKLANDLKRCSYYETCATYGLNVERVFQDACQKILQQRLPLPPSVVSRPTTPQGSTTRLGIASYHHNSSNHSSSSGGIGGGGGGGGSSTGSAGSGNSNGFSNNSSSTGNLTLPHRHHVLSTSSHHIPMRMSAAEFVHNESATSSTQQQQHPVTHNLPPNQKIWQREREREQQQQLLREREHHQQQHTITNENNNITKYNSGLQQQQQQQPQKTQHQMLLNNHHPQHHHQSTAGEQFAPLSLVPLREPKDNGVSGNGSGGGGKDLPTPTSTPTTSRKSRRRSNLFIPSSSKKGDKDLKNGELGSGRSIPIKQGYLYKRSSKSLNKEWKKKYVTLCDDGRLTYHPSLHDYMEDIHGKEIPLQYVTVKVPGQKPRGSKSIITNSALTTSMLSNAFETLREPGKSNSSQQTSGDDEGIAMSNSNSQTYIAGVGNTNGGVDVTQSQRELLPVNATNKLESQTPNVKKRHRRIKSSSVKANEVDDSDAFEFFIVSLDSKQWHFEAANSDERDEWVAAIEQEIFKSLQSNESAKMKPATTSELAAMVAIRTRVPGNNYCVDCDAPNPEWASLNLGVLLCIECSGIHRNLGSHISKVRSLGLDDWSPSQLSVMLAIGNSLANTVWEANTRQRTKPKPNSTREEKESWARCKYEAKEFLAQCNPNSNATPGQQLIEAVIKSDMKSIVILLANGNNEVVNASVSNRDVRTPLLLACAIGNLAIAQLLIWNGANIKQMDHEGQTSLAYARAAQSLAIAKSIKSNETTNSIGNTNTNSSNTSTTSSSSSSVSASVSASASASASTSMAATTATTTGVTLANNTNAISSNSSSASSTTATTTATTTTTNGGSGIPTPHYSVEDTTALVELLTSLGCPESAPLTASGTLPRRRDTLGTPYEKTTSGVI